MTYDDFKALCEERRSIRYFDQKPVSNDDVLKLLELARLSPSVENTQPWHFHVIYNKDVQRKLIDESYYGNFVEGVGVFLIVTCNITNQYGAKEPVWNPRELEYSCMSAMENVLLGAAAMGLGSCWVSLHRGDVHEMLSLPAHEIVVGGIMLGHYKKGEEKPSGKPDRKPLKDIYTIHE